MNKKVKDRITKIEENLESREIHGIVGIDDEDIKFLLEELRTVSNLHEVGKKFHDVVVAERNFSWYKQAELEKQIEELKQERNKLLDGYPEGETPTDIKKLKEYNLNLAMREYDLLRVLDGVKSSCKKIAKLLSSSGYIRTIDELNKISNNLDNI